MPSFEMALKIKVELITKYYGVYAWRASLGDVQATENTRHKAIDSLIERLCPACGKETLNPMKQCDTCESMNSVAT